MHVIKYIVMLMQAQYTTHAFYHKRTSILLAPIKDIAQGESFILLTTEAYNISSFQDLLVLNSKVKILIVTVKN
jgi:hypothetical protein